MTVPALTGAFLRLWVGNANTDTGIIPLALLHKQTLEVYTEAIFLYEVHCNVGDSTLWSLEPSLEKISSGEGGVIDVKLTSNKVWILKEEGLIMQDLLRNDFTEGLAHFYALQETFVANQLFQSSEHSSDDLLWLAYSAFSSVKEEIIPFVSSVFLRALLSPGVYCNGVLRQTLGDYNKHFTDSEFGSFTADGLKGEILSLIEHQISVRLPFDFTICTEDSASVLKMKRKPYLLFQCLLFRAASVEGTSKALQSLPHEAGWLRIDFSSSSAAAWKLQYYQWVMQLFEQYNESEAACQFALAALEQVDEALGSTDSSSTENLGESVTTVKGRLWANVFKFTLDLNNYNNAYCAIISNPDEESKTICLRRFIIVLYERGAIKILCDGQFPLTGSAEKVERELAWKAEHSDISAKPKSLQTSLCI